MGTYSKLLEQKRMTPDGPSRTRSPHKSATRKVRKRKTKIVVNQSVDQQDNRPVGQSVDQSTDALTNVDTLGAVVSRPKAFYITEKVDHWLDEAVRYLQEREGIHKADRSILVNAILHNPALYQPDALKVLKRRLLAHLTNKSLKA